MSITISSASGLPFANTTNSLNSKRRSKLQLSKTRFPLGFALRKAGPTCTVSLAVVNAQSSSYDDGSSSTVPFPCTADMPMPLQVDVAVPFPAGPAFDTEPSESGCSHLTLASEAPHPFPTPNRRRQRSNAYLAAPLPSVAAAGKLRSPGVTRRRVSSGKGRKSKVRPSSDVQFAQLLQRSVAWRLAERGLLCLESSEDSEHEEGKGDELEAQDLVLVHRLRAYIVAQGCKPWRPRSSPLAISPAGAAESHSIATHDPSSNDRAASCTPLPSPSSDSYFTSAPSIEPSSPTPPQQRPNSLMEGTPLAAPLAKRTSVDTPPPPPTVAPLPTLVASLILRHKERSTLRKHARSRSASPYACAFERPNSRAGSPEVDATESEHAGDYVAITECRGERKIDGVNLVHATGRSVASPLALCVSTVEMEADGDMDVDVDLTDRCWM